eukprot:1108848-Rhodomonas_salina.1
MSGPAIQLRAIINVSESVRACVAFASHRNPPMCDPSGLGFFERNEPRLMIWVVCSSVKP